MALQIETFSNASGGSSFFKAAGHPLAARQVPELLKRLGGRPLALYDPFGFAEAFAELYGLAGLELAGVYVQDVNELGTSRLGRVVQPITDLAGSAAEAVLVMAFDAARPIQHIAHLIPEGAVVESLDALRLPTEMLSDRRRYLSGLNFATNFVFFRDQDGHHTRLTTANYWSLYGAEAPALWCCLFDAAGEALAEWREALPAAEATVAIDSAKVRARFGLPAFTGQLFIHVVGAAGHDTVKYALDTYGDDGAVLSATHDANAWPAALYAGLPAPGPDEKVLLWVQNSHPVEVPPGAISLNLMGRAETRVLAEGLAPFATRALDTRELFPEAAWPAQFEVGAGKHMVRPRYEVLGEDGRRRIAHVNVERTDLKPDPRIPELANLMGKGYLLPAPLLPTSEFATSLLPTPMATGQDALPIKLLAFDAEGRELTARPLGLVPRGSVEAIELDRLLDVAGGELKTGWGHLELVYDFTEGGGADGWLHAIFRYRQRSSGHAAETSFGAHIFNSVLTYKKEPQSYAGPAPGLSTRLFLRLGPPEAETFCHLIYPASTPWHARSDTQLSLRDSEGGEVAASRLEIACSGSRLWRVSELFDQGEIRAAAGGYVLVRDTSCRLFGYHGLMHDGEAFSLDHMFGF